MNVAVIGSRDWPFKNEIKSAIASLEKTDVLISGGARGADTIAEHFAKLRGIECVVYLPDWELFGKGAGFIRNRSIINAADRVIAFQNEGSRGTQHSIDLALKKGIPVKLHSYTEAHGMQIKNL